MIPYRGLIRRNRCREIPARLVSERHRRCITAPTRRSRSRTVTNDSNRRGAGGTGSLPLSDNRTVCEGGTAFSFRGSRRSGVSRPTDCLLGRSPGSRDTVASGTDGPRPRAPITPNQRWRNHRAIHPGCAGPTCRRSTHFSRVGAHSSRK